MLSGVVDSMPAIPHIFVNINKNIEGRQTGTLKYYEGSKSNGQYCFYIIPCHYQLSAAC